MKTLRKVSPALALVGKKNPVLHAPAEQIPEITKEIRELAIRMKATLGRHPGVSIAAPQVGRGISLVVDHARAIANVQVKCRGERIETEVEGCLSLPGRWFEVPRHWEVTVSGLDVMTGEMMMFDTEGFDARVWQHERDHLMGLLLEGRYPEKRGHAGNRIMM